MKRWIACMLVFLLLLSGCKKAEETKTTDSEKETAGTEETVEETGYFTKRDYETGYDETKAAVIELLGTGATCTSDAVSINGSTITIKDEGTYIFRGTLEDGMIIVDAREDSKPQIVLDNVKISSSTSSPIYILEADKVFLTLSSESENVLSNEGTFLPIDDVNIDAVVFSRQDLTFNGEGSLRITSLAGHGIVCKDDLVFTGGIYDIESASKGIDANDSVRIDGAEITVDAGKDGIHAENTEDAEKGFVYIAGGTMNIEAEGDGISAGADLTIKDGMFEILSGGGSENASRETSDSWGGFKGGPMGGGHGGKGSVTTESQMSQSETESEEDSTSIKGIKAEGDLVIDGGAFVINTADDSIHSNSSITVNGGTFAIASGDDGFHSDDTLTINECLMEITTCYEGLEALHVKINGGNIKLTADDDGLNAAGGNDSSGTSGPRGDDRFGGPDGGSNSSGTIVISGGSIYILASGDGIDSNGSLTVNGGYTVVAGPARGDTATLDYDTTAVIDGGTFIGTGASGMAQTFSDSSQGVIAVSVGSQPSNTDIVLSDADGNSLIEYAPELDFGVVIISSPDLIKGETYHIQVGTAEGSFEAQ